MKAFQPHGGPASHPADQLELFTTIDEFLRSGNDVYQLLAAFCSTGPADNGRSAACTTIDQFSFTVAALRQQHRPSPDQR